jgi:hypothetical protein
MKTKQELQKGMEMLNTMISVAEALRGMVSLLSASWPAAKTLPRINFKNY